MQGRLFESGWGKGTEEDTEHFRQEADNAVKWLIRKYKSYHQLWGRREEKLTPDEVRLKDDIEEFLYDVVWNRYWLRSRIGSDGEVANSIGKYLENPAWHDPIITAYLLVDLLDDELILLERDFHVGLFKGQGIDVDTVTLFAMTRGYFPVKDRMKNWLKRFIWQAGILFVSVLLISKGWGAIQNPSYEIWVGVVGILIGILMIIGFSIGGLTRLKYQRFRRRIVELAVKFQTIRFEIAEQPYHAKTLTERVKKLEDQGLGVNSLIYALLELGC